MKQSIPMIPWNKQQEMGLQSEAFILLLHKLGIHLPADVGKCFPRIPHFWSADHIYQLAQKLGPIRKEKLKIDLTIFDTGGKNNMLTKSKNSLSYPNKVEYSKKHGLVKKNLKYNKSDMKTKIKI